MIFEQQQGTLSISGKIQHIPRLSSVAISTQLIDPDIVKMQWSEPIQRLINGCGFEVQMHYFLKDDKTVLSINCS